MGLRFIGIDLLDEKCELVFKLGVEYVFNLVKDFKFIEKIIEVINGGVYVVVNILVYFSVVE